MGYNMLKARAIKMQKYIDLLISLDICFIENSNGTIFIYHSSSGERAYTLYTAVPKLYEENTSAAYVGERNVRKVLEYFAMSEHKAEKSDLRNQLESWYNDKLGDSSHVLVTVVETPTGEIETIVDHTRLQDKMDYLLSTYDEQMRLRGCNEIRIIGILLC